jgi:hypothetical protein
MRTIRIRAVCALLLVLAHCASPVRPPQSATPDLVVVDIPVPKVQAGARAPDGQRCADLLDRPSANPWVGATAMRPRIDHSEAFAPTAVNVSVTVNTALMRAIPPWDRAGVFMAAGFFPTLRGSSQQFDVVQSTDWAVIYGPSLIPNDDNVVFIKANEPDSVLDAALAQVAQTNGTLTPGVHGDPSTTARVGGAERVFLRPHPKELVVVPPTAAAQFSRLLAASHEIRADLRPREIFREVIRNPKEYARAPIELPYRMTELRIWIETLGACGAEIHFEGDCGRDCTVVRNTLARNIQEFNAGTVQAVTHHILDNAQVEVDGTGVKLRLLASRDHLDSWLALGKLLNTDW